MGSKNRKKRPPEAVEPENTEDTSTESVETKEPEKKEDEKDTPLPENSRQVQMKPGQGFLDDMGRTVLEEIDLLKAENLRLRARERTTAALKLHSDAEKIRFNAELSERACRTDALAAEREAAKFQKQQEKLFIELGPKYGIDFKLATYDDETGIITVFEDENKPKESDVKGSPDTTVN